MESYFDGVLTLGWRLCRIPYTGMRMTFPFKRLHHCEINFFLHFRVPYYFKNMLQNFCSDICKIIKDIYDFVQPHHGG